MTVSVVFAAELDLELEEPYTVEQVMQAVQDEIGHTGAVVHDVVSIEGRDVPPA